MNIQSAIQQQFNTLQYAELFQHIHLFHDFEKTPQDLEWHSEGNVLIHNDMVLDEMYKIINHEAKNLSDDEKTILVLAALFHDICKPITTKEKEIQGKIRIVSPYHEEKARNYLFFKLSSLIPKHLIMPIIELVGYHQLPKLLVVKDKSKKDYLSLSRKAPMHLFYYLELADMRGRHCTDKQEQLDYLEMFKLYSIDYNIWQQQPYQEEKLFIQNEFKDNLIADFVFHSFCKNIENGSIFSVEEEISKSFHYKNNSHCVLLCGLSGSGKSTFIKNNFPQYNIVSLDNIREELTGKRSDHSQEGRVKDLAKQKLKLHLGKKEPVVWDATNYRKDFRNIPLGLANDYNSFSEVFVLHTTLQQCLKNNKDRQHSVPEDVIYKQMDNFELPEINEALKVNFII